MSYQHLTMVRGRQLRIDEACSKDIRMDEIAHSLSLINRYNGHTLHPYSVAQHTLNLVAVMEVDLEIMSLSTRDRAGALFAAVLHDAAEAYIGDITRPIKQASPGYEAMEEAFEGLIFERYGLPREYMEYVRRFDDSITANEMAYFFPELPEGANTFEPLKLNARELEEMFCERDWRIMVEAFHRRASLAWGDWQEVNR